MNQADPNAPKAETAAQLKKRLAREAAAANSSNPEQNEQTKIELNNQNSGQDGQNPSEDPSNENPNGAGDSNEPKADENIRYYHATSGDLLSCWPLQLTLRGKSTTQRYLLRSTMWT